MTLVAQKVMNTLAILETWVQSLCQEDLLEESMAIHSSILTRRTPWTEELGSYNPQGGKESDTTEVT